MKVILNGDLYTKKQVQEIVDRMSYIQSLPWPGVYIAVVVSFVVGFAFGFAL